MTDLPGMTPCTDSRGHNFMALWTMGDEVPADYTFACKRCCAIRRVPTTGPLYVGSLDARTPAEIRKAVGP